MSVNEETQLTKGSIGDFIPDVPYLKLKALIMSSITIGSIISKLDTPNFLYHGSGYKQDELMPGFMHSKKLVVWDRYESNTFLYASSARSDAEILGISSAWEKKYDLKRTNIRKEDRTIELEFYKNPPSLEELLKIKAYLYILNYDPTIWSKNNNPFNNIDTEYKTKETIKKIVERIELDVPKLLNDFTITIK